MKKNRKNLDLPDMDSCKAILEEQFSQQQPHHDHGAHIASGTRFAEHKGHTIEIKTSYEINIDDKPFMGDQMVGDDGHLHCQSIPYETYGSAIDFVKN